MLTVTDCISLFTASANCRNTAPVKGTPLLSNGSGARNDKNREMAEKLLKLYAERKVARGFLFSEDTDMHRDFDDFFPYDETPDQIKAFEEIQKHMHSENPMDMLLC